MWANTPSSFFDTILQLFLVFFLFSFFFRCRALSHSRDDVNGPNSTGALRVKVTKGNVPYHEFAQLKLNFFW